VVKYWLPDASWSTLANAVERMGGLVCNATLYIALAYTYTSLLQCMQGSTVSMSNSIMFVTIVPYSTVIKGCNIEYCVHCTTPPSMNINAHLMSVRIYTFLNALWCICHLTLSIFIPSPPTF
jgi:hypothetical protein